MGKFEDVIAGGDVEELTELGDVLAKGPVDMTPLLTRRFAWDVMQCSLVPGLLEALQMQLGSEEGMNHDHRESHHRMSAVMPLEGMLQAYGHILASVLTKAMLMTQGIEPGDEEEGFVLQNRELIVAASRATVAQLMASGVIQYGPAAGAFSVIINDHEDDDDDEEGEDV